MSTSGSSVIPPSQVAGMADVFLVLARWAIDPERPAEPEDLAPGLLKRLEGVYKDTMAVLGPVALPEFQSLFGGASLPALPTLIRPAAVILDLADRLPAYNTINAAIRTLVEGPTKSLTPSQSIVARILLAPLERPGAIMALRAAITEGAPASAFGLTHIVNAWLHSAIWIIRTATRSRSNGSWSSMTGT